MSVEWVSITVHVTGSKMLHRKSVYFSFLCFFNTGRFLFVLHFFINVCYYCYFVLKVTTGATFLTVSHFLTATLLEHIVPVFTTCHQTAAAFSQLLIKLFHKLLCAAALLNVGTILQKMCLKRNASQLSATNDTSRFCATSSAVVMVMKRL